MRKPLGASTEPRDVTKQMLGYRALRKKLSIRTKPVTMSQGIGYRNQSP